MEGGTVVHIESHEFNGNRVRVACDCELGKDHSYMEWQRRYGTPSLDAQ